MYCPKCQGMVGREFVATQQGACFMPYCIFCGWRPTRAPHPSLRRRERRKTDGQVYAGHRG
jgi:hypothetical protein